MRDHLKRLFLSSAAVAAICGAAAGCATPWFGSSKNATDAPAAAPSTDGRAATAAYINSLCKLAKDQRDPRVRELNESLLPNHATISCGPGSGTD
jgi:hypothetical protein